jgi:small nuclear ribonucleoprotein (snRNP)-like protein
MRWISCLAVAVMMTTASVASAEPPDPRWTRLTDHAVVVEKQDGGLVAGQLVAVDEGHVEVMAPDGSRTVLERSQIKAVRTRLNDQQVTVTTANDVKVHGKLAESDDETIVVETDDGQRTTVARVSIKTVRERRPEALPLRINVVRASDATHKPTEESPPDGLYLISSGAIVMGFSAGSMAGAPLWLLNGNLGPSGGHIAMFAQLGVGGLFFVLGSAALITGAVQRTRLREWRRRGNFGFEPVRGGGALTWRGAF